MDLHESGSIGKPLKGHQPLYVFNFNSNTSSLIVKNINIVCDLLMGEEGGGQQLGDSTAHIYMIGVCKHIVILGKNEKIWSLGVGSAKKNGLNSNSSIYCNGGLNGKDKKRDVLNGRGGVGKKLDKLESKYVQQWGLNKIGKTGCVKWKGRGRSHSNIVWGGWVRGWPDSGVRCTRTPDPGSGHTPSNGAGKRSCVIGPEDMVGPH